MAKDNPEQKIKSQAQKEYEADSEALDVVERSWNVREEMLMSHLGSTGTAKSKISDGGLTTYIIERAARVMAQLPSGVVKAIGKKDKGKSLLMDLILTRYIQPNANAQNDHLIKLRQWDMFSMVYGTQFVFVDWDVREDYQGPDFWLIPARNATPQAGRISVQDCDHFFVDRYISWEKIEKELEDKNSVWNHKVLREVLKSRTKDEAKDPQKTSRVEELRYATVPKGEKCRTVTKYTREKIITYFPDCGWLEGKDEKNELGEIPVVGKFDIPLMDSIWGLATMERGRSVQRAKDSLINIFHEGAKHFVFPPTIIQPNQVIANTLRWGPGKFWQERQHGAIRRLDNNPGGLNVFQGVMQFLNGVQQNQLGTTTTEVTQLGGADPQFGRTPAAIKQQTARESTRDNQDRFFMENSIQRLYNLMMKLTAKNATSIKVDLMSEEIDQILEHYPDVKDIVKKKDSGEYEMRIGKKHLADVDYIYNVDPGSTRGLEKDKEKEELSEILLMASKVSELEAKLQQSGWKLDLGALIKKIVINTGTEEADNIIYPIEQDDLPQKTDQPGQAAAQPTDPQTGLPFDMSGADIQDPQTAAVFKQIAEQAFGQTPGGVPGVNPPAPNPVQTGAQGGNVTGRESNNINSLG